jgi:hypothetical protein
MASLRRAAGYYEKRPISKSEFEDLTPWQRSEHNGFATGVFLDRRLAAKDRQFVRAHELGHVIDDIAGIEKSYKPTQYGRPIPFGEIPVSKDMQRELAFIYRDLNKGKSPLDFGYTGGDARSEYMAEAIRAYMADPNYIKSVAPKTAAAIREAVNTNPRLNKYIQFNALPATAGAGATLGTAFSGASQSEPVY